MHRVAFRREHLLFGVAWRVQLLMLLVDSGTLPTKKKSGKRLVSEEREEGEKVKK